VTVICGLYLRYPEGPDERCHRPAAVHILFGTGQDKPVCVDCHQLLVRADPTTTQGVTVPTVAFHDLSGTCTTERHLWRDRTCQEATA